ncbi:hypothetical protein LTR09_006124 [Extremus antarcticus]|uniref:NAD-dependent epimerase/dehydratase domain-containing protein n=1 Tax=Extremus antarcticus TaxID=702011 RepID=A0AAJ0DF36_9PEZI|nr:hypothetical protein LTR09_006124 [Extremus antarcticus]
MAQGDHVLLTGATGHLGFRVLLYLLEHGYQVRAAVRSAKKSDALTSNPSLKALNRGSQLSFTTVPDFLAANAFDEAVQGIKYIVHVASPIPKGEPEDGDYDAAFYQPAIRGTLGVLESAQKAGGVKRIVVTSSAVALTGPSMGIGGDGTKVWNSKDRQDGKYEPFTEARGAYAASKVYALNEAEAWIAKEKPAFDVIHIHPAFIFGRDNLADDTATFQTGTNKFVVNVALGNATAGVTLPLSYTHVDDSALAHVLALNPKVEGNQSFILSNSGQEGESYADIVKVVEEKYPEQVKSGLFKGKEAWGSAQWNADVKKTEELLGRKQAGLEEVTVSVLDHYVEVAKKEQE